MNLGMSANELIVAGWREGTADDSPAGPLFVGGEYAESEIESSTSRLTQTLCTACTSESGRYCC